MFEISIHNQHGEAVGKQELPSHIFGVKMKRAVVQFVIWAHRANQRVPSAHTKTRGEVRGGGKKPWRQKGTGRARQGSIRAPQWRGGGIAFGPRKERNYTVKMNAKIKEKALRMVLTDKAENQKIKLIDSFSMNHAKTKDMQKMFQAFGVTSVLLSLGKQYASVVRATKNIPKTGTLAADSLNVYDLLKYEYLLLDQEALKKILEKRKT